MNQYFKVMLISVGFVLVMGGLYTYFEFEKTSQFQQNNSIHSYVNEIEKLDASLDKQILLINSWYFSNYDSVNQVSSKYQELLDTPPYLPKKLESVLLELNRQLASKTGLIEQVKSNNAVLRNSLNYLPALTNQIALSLEVAGEQEQLTNVQINVYKQYMYRLAFQGIASQIIHHRTGINEKIPSLADLPAEVIVFWKNLNVHIKMLIEVKQLDKDLHEQIEQIEMKNNIELLAGMFSEYLEESDKQLKQYQSWFVGYLFIGFITITGFFIALRYYNHQHRKYKNETLTDPLTGLGNRRKLDKAMSVYVDQARKSKTTVGVFFIDLDGFKNVNDTLGHKKGDQLLQQMAKNLESSLRLNDLITRIGGDEFVVVVPNANIEALQRIADQILELLTLEIEHSDESVLVSASIGISCYPIDTEGAVQLIEYADEAMYQAKADGRSCIRFFMDI